MGDERALRERIAVLEAANDKLADANGYLCAKVNELSDERARLRALAYKLIAELRVIEQHEPGTVFCPEFYWELAEGAGLEVPR